MLANMYVKHWMKMYKIWMMIHLQHSFLMSRENLLFYKGTFINSATLLAIQSD